MKNETLKKNFIYIFTVFIMLLLQACSSVSTNSDNAGFRRTYFTTNNDVKAKEVALQLRDKNVIVVDGKSLLNSKSFGYVSMLINTDNMFEEYSANLNNYGKSVLQDIVDFLSYYEVECLEVNNHFINKPDGLSVKGFSKALASERANKIVDYLWLRETNVSIIYAKTELDENNFTKIGFYKYKRS